MKPAIIYTRFSPRPNAKDCDSCEKQEERCREYLANGEWEDDEIIVFSDKKVSGGTLERPGLNMAIEALRPGYILAIDSSSRLARDSLIYHILAHRIETAGGIIEFADGSPPATTPEGKLFRTMLVAFDAFERDRIRLRTKQGLAKKKAAGQWLGKPPIGYRVDPDTKALVEDEKEQAAMRTAQRLRAQGYSFKGIAICLTSRGNFRGKLWSASTIRKILKKFEEGA